MQVASESPLPRNDAGQASLVLPPAFLTAVSLICAMAAARIVLPAFLCPVSPGFGRLVVFAIVFGVIPWVICGGGSLRQCLTPVSWKLILAGAAVGLANYLPALSLSWMSAELLGLVPPSAADMFSGISLSERAALAAAVIIAAPLGEELALRGGLQPLLCSRFSPIPGVLLTALFFALLHFDLSSLAAHVEMGAVFGLLAWSARSIWPAVAAHAAHNVTALAIVGWEATGGAPSIPLKGSVIAVLALASACLATLLLASTFRQRQQRAKAPLKKNPVPGDVRDGRDRSEA